MTPMLTNRGEPTTRNRQRVADLPPEEVTDRLFAALEPWTSSELGHFIGANRWRIEAGLASDEVHLAVGCAVAVLAERKDSTQGGFMTEPSFGTAIVLDAEFKTTGDGWRFSGYASTFNVVDQGGDVVLEHAFDRTLRSGKKRPLLWQHSMQDPIGIELDLAPDKHGLYGTWRIVDTARGSDAYKLLKAGALDSMSIGYIPTDVDFKGEVRVLKSVELLECSVVSLPMNAEALITGVKARQDGDDVHRRFMKLRIRQYFRRERQRESERLRQRLHTAALKSFVY